MEVTEFPPLTENLANWDAELWRHDPALVRCYTLATAPNSSIRAVSFDFFDTLIIRLAPRPVDVFYEVGDRLRKMGGFRDDVSPEAFFVYRRIAEGMAREKHIKPGSGIEDISLQQIYQELSNVLAKADVSNVEIEVEKDLCVLNPAVYSLACELQRRGLRLFVISDVYLSSGHLKGILANNGVPADFFNAIYTSSDAGVCKGTGKLFSWVLGQQQLKASELLHIGDNLSADVVGAKQTGVRSVHYVADHVPEYEPILRRETSLLGSQHPWFSLDAIRLAAARLFAGEDKESFFTRAGAMLLGPVLTRFAEWACDEFARAGVRKVGAFMREGACLGRLIQAEADRRGMPLEVKLLFANRTSTELAALGKLTADGVIDWLQRRTTLTAGAILDQFGISIESRKSLKIAQTQKLNGQADILRMAEFLFREDIARQIEARSREERRLFMDYFTGWLDGSPSVGVCDLGYNATAQWQIQRILELEGHPARLLGCYVVTCEKAAERALNGLEVRDFLGTFGHPMMHLASFLRSPAFVELCLNAPIGTTLGYVRGTDGQVNPILEDKGVRPVLKQAGAAFRRGVEVFQKMWHWELGRRSNLGDSQSPFAKKLRQHLDQRLPVILGRMAAFPLPEELEHFGSLSLDDRYLESGEMALLDQQQIQLFQERGYTGLLANQKVLWPQGAFHMANPGNANRYFQVADALLKCMSPQDYEIPHKKLVIISLWDLDKNSMSQMLESIARQIPRTGPCGMLLLVEDEKRSLAELKKQSIPSGLSIVCRELRKGNEWHLQINELSLTVHEPWIWFLPKCMPLPDLPWGEIQSEAGVAAWEIPNAGWVLRKTAWSESCLLQRGLSWDKAMQKAVEDLESLGWQVRRVAKTTSPITTISNPYPINVVWMGTFHDKGSLSHVNRELSGALGKCLLLPPAEVALDKSAKVPENAEVVVRHAWPPDWRRPNCRKFVVIQPWEYGCLPKAWVEQASGVDQFWVPSTYVQRVYRESGIPAEKVRVVPNGVNTNIFHPAASPRELATQKRFKFLFVGGTIFRKGADVLLQAYCSAFTRQDDVCLVIKDFGGKSFYAGQTMGDKIKALQQQPNAPEIIYLDEEWSDEEMAGLYTACDCLVHPYRGEGFGLPVLEAMACGLPVIVTRGGGADDFTPDALVYAVPATRRSIGNSISGLALAGEGWVLEPERETLIRWMRHVVQHPDEARQKGREASEFARSGWTWEHAARRAVQCLNELQVSSKPTSTENARQATAKQVNIELPPAGWLGNLQSARKAFQNKQWRSAWDEVLKAIALRPYHPEAYLLLAEIARAVNDIEMARRMAERSRSMAPAWKAPRKFLNQLHGKGQPHCKNWPQPPAEDAPPRLTVALIVKNEEAFLGQCLASVKDVANQIVVVDTGSTDRTVEIARAHGAEVHHFEWCDDFSAARNAMLEHVRGDWVLMLDADEELTVEGRAQLLEELRNPKVMAYRLPMEDVGTEDEGCSYVPRLWRNAPGLFFVGRVHEQIFSSIEVRRAEWGLENVLSRAKLRHYGYTAELTKSRGKVERNLRLLQRAVEELPDEPNLLMNLGLELVRSGRLDEALEQYAAAFESMTAKPPAQVVPELRESLLMQYTSFLMKARRFDRVIEVLRSPLATQYGGLTASLHFALGLSLLEQKRAAEAAVEMKACLAKRTQPTLSRINKLIHTAAPWHCLAKALAMAGDPQAAQRAFTEAISQFPDDLALRWDYACWLWQQQQAVPALEQLHALVSLDARRIEAWVLGGKIALSRPEYYEFALDWTGEAIKCHSDNNEIRALRAEALLLNGQIEDALTLLQQTTLNGHYHLHAARILCELALAQIPASLPQEKEAPVSLEFVGWYRRLIDSPAAEALGRVNDRLVDLHAVLPSAARLLQMALSEAAASEKSSAKNPPASA